MTNIRELIKKYKMQAINGGENIQVVGKPNQKETQFIISNKQEILSELKVIRKEEAEARVKAEAEKKNKDIRIDWHDGEYLQGYMTYQNGELLEELGLAKYVSGWGYLVAKEIVEALGKEFTADQARKYAKPAIEKANQERVEKQNEEKAKLDNAIEVAKVLGHKVEIDRYTVECDGSVEECDTDIITRYVDGKGNITTSRMHTH